MNGYDTDRKPPSYVPTLTEVVAVARDTLPVLPEAVVPSVEEPLTDLQTPGSEWPRVDLNAIVARLQQDLVQKLEHDLREQLAPLIDEVVKQAVQMAVFDSETLLKKALRDVVVQQSGGALDGGAN